MIVAESGTAQLVEFGFAATMDEAGERPRQQLIHSAPELLDGTSTTRSTDQYAFGVLAYTLLAGRRPWSIDSLSTPALRRRLGLGNALPLAEASRACDRRLGAIIDRTLQPDAARRFPSMSELVHEIGGWLRFRE